MSYPSDFKFVSSVEATTVHCQPRYENLMSLQKEVEISPAIATGYTTFTSKRHNISVPEHTYKRFLPPPIEHLERQPNAYVPLPSSLDTTATKAVRPDHLTVNPGSLVCTAYAEGLITLKDLTSPEPSIEPTCPTSINSGNSQDVHHTFLCFPKPQIWWKKLQKKCNITKQRHVE